MKSIGFASVVVAACAANVASAQVENGDLRIKAKFVTPDNGQWGADESVGNADFRIHSRFMAVYYGGVLRARRVPFQGAARLHRHLWIRHRVCDKPLQRGY